MDVSLLQSSGLPLGSELFLKDVYSFIIIFPLFDIQKPVVHLSCCFKILLFIGYEL